MSFNSRVSLLARSARDHVVALLVVHDGEEWLVDCLDALAASERTVDRLLVVDTGTREDNVALIERHAAIHRRVPSVEVLQRRPGADLVVACRMALRHLEERPTAVGHVPDDAEGPEPDEDASPTASAVTDDVATDWLWIVHDDSAPEPGALGALLRAAHESSHVAVVGPKQVMAEDPERFVDYGITTTTTGRRTGGPRPGELDQGQYDARLDVLGVGSSGLLARLDVLRELGGLDRSARGAEGFDLAWRAHLAGHRVVLAPRARVRERAAGARGVRPGGPGRRSARAQTRRVLRSVALARAPWWAAPWLWLRLLLSVLGSCVGLLLLGQPRAATAELGDLGALAGAPSRLMARWRFRGRRRVRTAHLSTLFVPGGTAFQGTLDAARDGTTWNESAEPDVAGATEQDDTVPETAAAPSSLAARLLTSPGLYAVLAGALVALAGMRHLLGGAFTGDRAGLTGGELVPVTAGSADLARDWLDPWRGAGLGGATAAAPWEAVLAAAAWVVELVPGSTVSAVGTAVAWLLLAAVPLAALTAYVGGAALTRHRLARAVAAVLWAGSGPLLAGLAQGRLGPVVAHVLLPPALGATALAVRRRSTLWPAFAAALLLALTGAFVPVLLVVASLVALVLVGVAPGWGARGRALVIGLVPWALLGPWLAAAWHRPLLLLSGPGTLTTGQAERGLHVALLQPGGPSPMPLALAPLLLVCAAVALVPSRRERGARVWLGALLALGLGSAVAARHVVLGTSDALFAEPGRDLHLWTGVPLQVAALAAWAVTLLGVRAVGGRRRVVLPATAFAATLAVLPWGFLAVGGLGGPLTSPPEAPSAAVAEGVRGDGSMRVLRLSRAGDGVGYRLLGREPGPVSSDLPLTHAPADPAVTHLVERIVSGPGGADEARATLAQLGVGFVQVPRADVEALGPLLDATPGLSRMGGGEAVLTWRVQPASGPDGPVPPARARLVDEQGRPLAPVAVQGPHGRTEADLPAAPGRTLVVSEDTGWPAQAQVQVDGKALEQVAGAPTPTYRVPDDGGRLTITLPDPHRPWHLAQLAALLVTALLALPLRRRGRTS